MRRILAACLLASALAAADPADALAALPALPRPQAQNADKPPFDPAAGTAIAPGVRMVPGERVVLDASFLFDKGPTDGLEVLACLREGKTHESLLRLTATAGDVIKAACIASFGLPDGRPAEENRGVPARGTPVSLTVLWRNEDGGWRWIDAASLVRDRRTDRPFPPLPFVWTGSRILLITENGPDGKPVRRERFMLDSTRSLAVNYDEPDALLASPFPCADEDVRFEANSAVCPPAGTAAHLVITPAPVVLQLRLAADGTLSRDGAALDDAALAAALAAAFAGPAPPAHHGVLVRTAVGVGDDVVVAARRRVLAAAAAGRAWAAPLFLGD